MSWAWPSLTPLPAEATTTSLFDYCTSLLSGLIASTLSCYSFVLFCFVLPLHVRDPFQIKLEYVTLLYKFLQCLSISLRVNTKILYIGLPSPNISALNSYQSPPAHSTPATAAYSSWPYSTNTLHVPAARPVPLLFPLRDTFPSEIHMAHSHAFFTSFLK